MVRLAMLKLDHAMFLAEAAASVAFYGVPAHGVGHPDAGGAELRLRAEQARRQLRETRKSPRPSERSRAFRRIRSRSRLNPVARATSLRS